MDAEKFTKKSLEVIESCEKLAYEYNNQELTQAHLMYAYEYGNQYGCVYRRM